MHARSGPQKIIVGWPVVSRMRVVVRSACGQYCGSPSGVPAQEKARMRSPISPPPARNARSTSAAGLFMLAIGYDTAMKYFGMFVLALTLLLTGLVHSGEPVFDSHVHLREGEASLLKFEAEVKAAGIDLAGVGAMWFGGQHQALAGDTAAIRAGNDGIIALAAKHPEVVPIGTVHPYDGQAALDELARIAARGVKTLKIHPHTQRFAIADPRVLALVTKAGELGMSVLVDNAGIVPGDCE